MKTCIRPSFPGPRRTLTAPPCSFTACVLFGLAVPVTAQNPPSMLEQLAPSDQTDIHGRGSRTMVRRFAVTGVMEQEAAGWRIRVLRAFQIWPGTAGEDSGG